MKNQITLYTIILLLISGCSAKKAAAETANTITEEESSEQINKDGYIQAIIENKTKGGCGFVIKKISTGEFFLPNNLEDKYKKDGLQVWLTIRPIRPAQGACAIGIPVTIEEIKIEE